LQKLDRARQSRWIRHPIDSSKGTLFAEGLSRRLSELDRSLADAYGGILCELFEPERLSDQALRLKAKQIWGEFADIPRQLSTDQAETAFAPTLWRVCLNRSSRPEWIEPLGPKFMLRSSSARWPQDRRGEALLARAYGSGEEPTSSEELLWQAYDLLHQALLNHLLRIPALTGNLLPVEVIQRGDVDQYHRWLFRSCREGDPVRKAGVE